MSSNDGLNLLAIVAGVRAIVDAVDTALELWHRLPIEVGVRTFEATWGLGVNVMRPHPDDPGACPALEVDVTVGPWCAWLETTRRGDTPPPVLDLDEDPFDEGREAAGDYLVSNYLERGRYGLEQPRTFAVAEAGAR